MIPPLLISKVNSAKSVAVLTGAGISAESGVATFRDPDGLWSRFSPLELASMDGFLANPDRVWEWYEYRRAIINSVQPNDGHFALAELSRVVPQFTLITQNVDRLHQAAGSRDVIELHGNLIDNHCQRCHAPHVFPDQDILNGFTQKKLPRCSFCGGLVRPSVVWFGENLPTDALSSAEQAALTCDVFFSIGTSAEVYPAAQLPYSAKSAGAFVCEVNPNETILTPFVDFHVRGQSAQALREIVTAVKAEREFQK